ncbi:MAG: hypothetical protein SGPRY_004041 [Prymnesium sp.]
MRGCLFLLVCAAHSLRMPLPSRVRAVASAKPVPCFTALACSFPAISASAAETSSSGLPPDALVIAIAVGLLVATGLLQLSLGDVAGDEAQLPSSVNLINKSRQKRSSFLKKK